MKTKQQTFLSSYDIPGIEDKTKRKKIGPYLQGDGRRMYTKIKHSTAIQGSGRETSWDVCEFRVQTVRYRYVQEETKQKTKTPRADIAILMFTDTVILLLHTGTPSKRFLCLAFSSPSHQEWRWILLFLRGHRKVMFGANCPLLERTSRLKHPPSSLSWVNSRVLGERRACEGLN